jgi:hypothetical protein
VRERNDPPPPPPKKMGQMRSLNRNTTVLFVCVTLLLLLHDETNIPLGHQSPSETTTVLNILSRLTQIEPLSYVPAVGSSAAASAIDVDDEEALGMGVPVAEEEVAPATPSLPARSADSSSSSQAGLHPEGSPSLLSNGFGKVLCVEPSDVYP